MGTGSSKYTFLSHLPYLRAVFSTAKKRGEKGKKGV